jgi:hypothetical protein
VRNIIADAGLIFTCPEPLASVAEEAEDEALEVVTILSVEV